MYCDWLNQTHMNYNTIFIFKFEFLNYEKRYIFIVPKMNSNLNKY